MLAKVHEFVGNWGWSIIIVTILLKLLFYKLTETSGRSMAKMRTISPRIKSIQERYKDDREQLAKQMMELYKREKINPVAGCLPIVVQIPVFLAFYWVLLESVEMRQAPFMLWIQDLSAKDPYFILPAIMGAAMFGQFKLNPAPPDPMQAKVFAFMPLVMTVMMAWFPRASCSTGSRTRRCRSRSSGTSTGSWRRRRRRRTSRARFASTPLQV